MKKINTNKKGFTIIEVVLVLAIAGLIFMMVFIALPALQRSQRDTQRSNDIARVQTALNQYQANNRGAIPSETLHTSGKDDDGNSVETNALYILGHETPASGGQDVKTWLYFYDNYLIVNSGGAQDVFADPDGGYYSLFIQACKPASDDNGKSTNAGPCTNGQRYDTTFDKQSLAQLDGENVVSGVAEPNGGEAGHSISVLTHATCQGEVAYYSTGSRKVALVYKKEGGGTICLNN